MYCPRLDHNVRLTPSGKVSKCGHMLDAPEFTTYEEMENSTWVHNIKTQMLDDIWPSECERCKLTEEQFNQSLRLNDLKKDPILELVDKQYLIVSGVLDNICNSACQSCNSNLSTKIGSLHGKDYIQINNIDAYNSIPKEHIVQIDINGGEPTASPNYKKILDDLPPKVAMVRINTNGSLYFKKIEELLEQNVKVVLTMSLDGTGTVHDYVRWPIKWDDYKENVVKYKQLEGKHKNLSINFWTTVSALNLNDLHNVLGFAQLMKTPIQLGFVHDPSELSIQYENRYTVTAKERFKGSNDSRLREMIRIMATKENNTILLDEYIAAQDNLRGINIKDYLS